MDGRIAETGPGGKKALYYDVSDLHQARPPWRTPSINAVKLKIKIVTIVLTRCYLPITVTACPGLKVSGRYARRKKKENNGLPPLREDQSLAPSDI